MSRALSGNISEDNYVAVGRHGNGYDEGGYEDVPPHGIATAHTSMPLEIRYVA
jgi:hypothetical protein